MKCPVHKNKHILVIIGVLFTIFLAGRFSTGTSFQSLGWENNEVFSDMGSRSVSLESAAYVNIGGSNGGVELGIMSGSATLDSEDIEIDTKSISEKVNEVGGHFEESHVQETDTRFYATVLARVPKAEMISFSEWLKSEFEVDSISVNSYKLDVTIQTSLVSIYTNSLEKYQSLMDAVDESELSSETVDALANLVEKMAYAQSRLEYASHQLAESTYDSEMSRFTITLTQEKDIQILPEEYGRTVLIEIKNTISEFLSAVVGAVLFLPIFLIKIAQYLVYSILLLLIGRPIWKKGKKYWKTGKR